MVALLASTALGDAWAGPSAARVEIRKRSAGVGLRASRLTVLARKPGEGDAVVARKLAAALKDKLGVRSAPGDFEEKVESRRLWLTGPDWTMQVADGGNSVKFRGQATQGRLPLGSKPSDAVIETNARNFIGLVLKDFVTLAPGEELVFLQTKFGYAQGQAVNGEVVNGTPDPAEITGYTAVFGRTVAGELVVGGGSTLAVLFNADGSLEGFDRDWPQYDKTTVQLDALDVTAIRARGKAMKLPAQAGDVEKEKGFECGYFDPGGRRRSKQSLVQPACIHSVVTTNAQSLSAGRQYVIPATRKPLTQTGWPELTLLCSANSTACRAAPVQ